MTTDSREQQICTECGQGVESGLMNWVRHFQECPHNAPNVNIESARVAMEVEAWQKERDRQMNLAWPHMNEGERDDYLMLAVRGIPTNDGLMFSLDNLKALRSFEDKMIEKYVKTNDQ